MITWDRAMLSARSKHGFPGFLAEYVETALLARLERRERRVVIPGCGLGANCTWPEMCPREDHEEIIVSYHAPPEPSDEP